MMNIWIENESAGKYLYMERNTDNTAFENGMLRSMAADCILYPKAVFKNGKSCYECNISGLTQFSDYMSRHSFGAEDLSSVLIQISNAVNAVKNYLLDENSLLLESENIFSDEKGNELKFCVLPGNRKSFEKSLRVLITELLRHVDTNSHEALRLGFRLFQAVSDPNYRLHDVLEKIVGFRTSGDAAQTEQPALDSFTDSFSEEAGEPRIHTTAAVQTNGLRFREAEEADTPRADTVRPDFFRSDPAEFPDQDPGKQQEPGPGIKEFMMPSLRGWLISQVILGSGVALVWLLKGAGLARKMLPFYLVFAVCVTIYYVVEILLKRRRNQTEEK
jgi:hypothetical protein